MSKKDEDYFKKLTSSFINARESPVSQSKKEEAVDFGEAAWQGAKQGLSFGFADEAVGALNSPKGALKEFFNKFRTNELTDEDVIKYRQARDEERLLNEQAAQENALAYYAGDIGSSILVPGAALKLLSKTPKALSLGQRLATAAGSGATMGAGTSDAEDIGELAKDTALGGVIGGGAGLAGEGISKLGKLAKESKYFKNVAAAKNLLDEGYDLTKKTDKDRFFDDASNLIKTNLEKVQQFNRKLMGARSQAISEADKAGVKFSLDTIEDAIKKAKKFSENTDIDSATKLKLKTFIKDMENISKGPEIEVARTIFKPGKTVESADVLKDRLIKNYEKKIRAGVQGKGEMPKSYQDVLDDISGKREIYATYDTPQPGSVTGSQLIGKVDDVPASYSEIIPEEVISKTRAGAPEFISPERASQIRKNYLDKAKFETEKTGLTEELYRDVTQGIERDIKSIGPAKEAIEKNKELLDVLENFGIDKSVIAKGSEGELTNEGLKILQDSISSSPVKQQKLRNFIKGIKNLQPEVAEALEKNVDKLELAKTVKEKDVLNTNIINKIMYTLQDPTIAAKIVRPVEKGVNRLGDALKKIPGSKYVDVTKPGLASGASNIASGQESNFENASNVVSAKSEDLEKVTQNVAMSSKERDLMRKLIGLSPGQRSAYLKSFSEQSPENRELLKKLGIGAK